MEAQSTATMRRLPQVLAMTLVVIGVPVLLVTLLVELFGTPDDVVSILVLTGVATGLSLCVSYLGAAFWTHRSRAGDVLFADLTLWGWLRRYRGERRLATATLRLGLREEPPAEQLIQLNSGERTQLLERLSGILESRHPDMYGHSRRVARHAAAIAEQLDLPPEEVARIRTAAAVHDVGKIYVSASILEKPGKLTTFEFGEIQRHAEFGAQMVAALGDPELTLMVRHHHERYDGSGYPAGLVGEEIPLGARIIAVADTFDAVTSERPYREAKPHREALALLGAEAGTQLDPDAVRAFRRYYADHKRVAFLALLLNGPRNLAIALVGGVKLGGVVLATGLAALGATGVAIESGGAANHAPAAQASPPAAALGLATTPAGGAGEAPSSHPAKEGSAGAAGDGQGAPGGAEALDPAPTTEGGGSAGGGSAPSQGGSDANAGAGGEGGSAGADAGGGAGAPSAGGGSGTQLPPTPVATPPETAPATAPVVSAVESTLESTKQTSISVTTPEISPVLPKVKIELGTK